MEAILSEEKQKKEPVKLEYFKAPFSKRIFAFLFDAMLMSIFALGCFYGARLLLENSQSYQSAFDTYVQISTDSGLYFYHETDDNLVMITEYYEEETYSVQNEKEETALSAFYQMEEFFPQDDSTSGLALYAAQKIGDSRIGASDDLSYFVYDEGGDLVSNPEYSDETMHEFYLSAVEDAIGYFSNVDAYVAASKTLSMSINFFIIPCSLIAAFLVFEFLIPLLFKRGWQTLGMRIFKLSLLNAQAVSPSFKSFSVRFIFLFFIETLGSLISFAIPIFVSFSMMVFRKDGQSFHDYMSGTYMVDSSEQSIYISPKEREFLLKKAEETEARNSLLVKNCENGSETDGGDSSEKE